MEVVVSLPSPPLVAESESVALDSRADFSLCPFSFSLHFGSDLKDLSEALPPSIIPRSQPTHKAYLDFAREKNRFSRAAILGPGAYGV